MASGVTCGNTYPNGLGIKGSQVQTRQPDRTQAPGSPTPASAQLSPHRIEHKIVSLPSA
ncbi:hypothetical protein KRM28CT15_45180 [Krasilnikovia sp. M28-CT-15]